MEHAIRHLQSAWDLQDNSLCRIAAVQDRAAHTYGWRPGAEALALRDLVEEAIILAGDLLDPAHETFLRRWVATGNIAAVAREMGKGPLAPLAGLSATGRHGRDRCVHEPYRPWKAPDAMHAAAPVAAYPLAGIVRDHP